MKTILFYANCQGKDGLGNLINNLLPGQFKITSILVHGFIKNNIPLDIELFKNADIFIHQPIHDRHGDYSTKTVTEYLKPDCELISFPYIYNSAFFTTYGPMINYTIDTDGIRNEPSDPVLFKNKSFLHGFGHVHDLIRQNKSLEEVIRIFRKGDMEFNFDRRWDICISKLKEREQICDIKVADFIDSSKNKHMLFLQHNHPTSCVYLYMLEQIAKLLKIELPGYSGHWDISDMLKRVQHPVIDEWIGHFNTHNKWIQAVDKYSKKQWNSDVLINYVDNDKYTENEIIDYYIRYCIKIYTDFA